MLIPCMLCMEMFEPKVHNQVYCKPQHRRQAENVAKRIRQVADQADPGLDMDNPEPPSPYEKLPSHMSDDVLAYEKLFTRVEDRQQVLHISDVVEGERAVVLADLQIPFQDVPLLGTVLAFIRDFQPSRVFLDGDVGDMYSVSVFDKNPTRRFHLEDEAKAVRAFLDELRSVLDEEAVVYFLDGNHEWRLIRELMKQGGEFYGLMDEDDGSPLVSIPKIYGLNKRGIVHVNWPGRIDYAGCIITHGPPAVRGAYNAKHYAKWMLERVKSSGISGDMHRNQVYMEVGDKGQSRGWISTGCLCRLDPDFCVDEDTEIMTQRGWLTVDNVRPGDLTPGLTSYGANAALAWQPIQSVNVFPPKNRIILASVGRYDALRITQAHGLPVRAASSGNLEARAAAGVGPKDGLLTAVQFASQGAEWPSPHLAALVGWYLAEGSDHRRQITICQSGKVNPDFCGEIVEHLAATRNVVWAERKPRPDGLRTFALTVRSSDAIREWAPNKAPRWDILTRWHRKALLALWEALLKGDGTWRSRRLTFTQKAGPVADFFQALCVRLGIQHHRYDDKKGMVRIACRRHSSKRATREIGRLWPVAYSGRVWCPTTTSGSWVARRAGKVFVSLNSPFPDWQQGFVYSEVIKGQVHPELVPVFDRAFYAAGEPYSY